MSGSAALAPARHPPPPVVRAACALSALCVEVVEEGLEGLIGVDEKSGKDEGESERGGAVEREGEKSSGEDVGRGESKRGGSEEYCGAVSGMSV